MQITRWNGGSYASEAPPGNAERGRGYAYEAWARVRGARRRAPAAVLSAGAGFD